MPKDKYTKARASKSLHQIGRWATLWWGLTCFYIFLLVWQAEDYFVSNPSNFSVIKNSANSISSAFQSSVFLQILLVVIIIGWIIGGALWLKALKKQKISYRVAITDLFFTIRK